jgi:hypothetical protein
MEMLESRRCPFMAHSLGMAVDNHRDVLVAAPEGGFIDADLDRRLGAAAGSPPPRWP